MVRDNVLRIRKEIASICSQASRDCLGITLVAVTKGRHNQEISEAVTCGISDIGENRVQEVLAKYNDLRYAIGDTPIRWHLVGHLQTNKAKEAVRIFDLIHSVDSLHLAGEIDKQATAINKVQDILIQVNTSAEPSKFGLKTEDAIPVIREITKLKNIKIKGLMTIAPVVDNPEKARPYFRMLREIRDKINDMRLAECDMRYLSMGMSDDFRVAIEEGSNMVRIGRAIFSRQ